MRARVEKRSVLGWIKCNEGNPDDYFDGSNDGFTMGQKNLQYLSTGITSYGQK